jgi:hypothetical protein
VSRRRRAVFSETVFDLTDLFHQERRPMRAVPLAKGRSTTPMARGRGRTASRCPAGAAAP